MDWRKHAIKCVKIIIGGALVSVGLQFLLIPNAMVLGGVSGLATIVHFLTGWPTGMLITMINIPIFVLALIFCGRSLVIYSFLGVITTSVLVDALAVTGFVVTDNLLLVAVYAGVLVGTGGGLMLSAGASAGGTDLAARVIHAKLPNRSLGQFILILDASIVALGALVIGRYESALFAGISVFILIRIIDYMLYDREMAKLVYIISETRGDEIRERIIRDMNRGVTILHGEGGHSGREKTVLLCALKGRLHIIRLKQDVKLIDPDAFVIISDAKEVLGRGFSSTIGT